jgi:hypothetical protein
MSDACARKADQIGSQKAIRSAGSDMKRSSGAILPDCVGDPKPSWPLAVPLELRYAIFLALQTVTEKISHDTSTE